MARSVEELLQRAKAGRYDERLKNVVASYRFDIEGVSSVRIEVDHGQIRVREDPSRAPADCVISSSAEDCLRIFSGEQNMLTAYMQGRVHVSGDVALAVIFYGALPGPQAAAEEGAQP